MRDELRMRYVPTGTLKPYALNPLHPPSRLRATYTGAAPCPDSSRRALHRIVFAFRVNSARSESVKRIGLPQSRSLGIRFSACGKSTKDQRGEGPDPSAGIAAVCGTEPVPRVFRSVRPNHSNGTRLQKFVRRLRGP